MEVRSVESIIRALNDAEVQYLIVGGLAVNAHGYVRLTRDVDIVLHLQLENVLCALATFKSLGYQSAIPVPLETFADPKSRETWRSERFMIAMKLWSEDHRRTSIDLFIYEPFDFQREASHAVTFEISPGVLAPVISFETLIEMKLSAGRPHDLLDIEELQRLR